ALRSSHLFAVVRAGLANGSRSTFRLVHFSVQANHVHLLVEADQATSMQRGMQGLGVTDVGIDSCSSGRWFAGWREPVERAKERVPIAPPRTWLLRVGWRRRGLIDAHEGPAIVRGRARPAGPDRPGGPRRPPAAGPAEGSGPPPGPPR